MRGASAKALDGVLATVDETVADGAPTDALGSELFEVVGLLDQQPPLRRVLTDPSSTADAKDGLVRSVFGGKIADGTLDVLADAVTRRWTGSRDLADGLERAGVAAYVAGAEAEGTLDDLEDDLFRFGRIVAGDGELRGVLTDRSIPTKAKIGLLDSLLEGKSSTGGRALIDQAVAERGARFEVTLGEFGELAAARRQRLLATVRVAHDLDADQRDRLAQALATRYDGQVHLNVIVDPDVIGGISVEIGDEVIDGTIASRLEDVRRRIAG